MKRPTRSLSEPALRRSLMTDVRPMEFTATETGFEDGMGGASNSPDGKDYHYVLFGRQSDGVYFEFDDQIHGAVDCVTGIVLADEVAQFELRDGQKIVVRCSMAEPQWSRFVRGIHEAFPHDIVRKV